MIKFFCDKCGVEVTKHNRFCSFDVEVGHHVINIGAVNQFIDVEALCKTCVLDAIRATDDRPRLA